MHPSHTLGDSNPSVSISRTDGLALHSILSAELAGVTGMLADLKHSLSAKLLAHNISLRSLCTYFHLLDLLSQRGAIARTVLAGDADLLRAFGHCVVCGEYAKGGIRVQRWRRPIILEVLLPRWCLA